MVSSSERHARSSHVVAALSGFLLLSGCIGAAKPNRAGVANIEAQASVPPPTEAPAATAPPPPPCADDDFVGCTHGCDDKRWEDCATLGSLYLDGSSVQKDEAHAMELFRLACEGRSARGCMRLADAHHAGLVDDPIEEAHLYGLACEGGANGGCLAAGLAYLEGHGVLKLPRRAAELFEPACQRGNATACYELGRLLLGGDGIDRDYPLARELLFKACQLGSEPACIVEEQAEQRAAQVAENPGSDEAAPPDVPELPELPNDEDVPLDLD